MHLLKLCAVYVLVCLSYVASKEMTYQEKAYLLSETKCRSLENPFVAAPILLSAAHLVLVGHSVEILNPMQGRYSMKVTPKCIMKGDTNEMEIRIQNLGKTKCGSSNVEVGFNYLFFLRNTSDPKVFHALNSGVQPITSRVIWTDVFVMLCGISRRVVCARNECPEACSYRSPDATRCIPGDQTVYDTFRNEFPKGLPTTTRKPSTSEMVKTNAPQAVTPKSSVQKVTTDSKLSAPKTTPMPKEDANKEASKVNATMVKVSKSTTVSSSEVTSSPAPSVNNTLPKTMASINQTSAVGGKDGVMMEKTGSDNKTDTKYDSKQNKAAPYTPMVNGTVAVQQSKSDPNGHGNNINSNAHLVAVALFIFHLLRS